MCVFPERDKFSEKGKNIKMMAHCIIKFLTIGTKNNKKSPENDSDIPFRELQIIVLKWFKDVFVKSTEVKDNNFVSAPCGRGALVAGDMRVTQTKY